jgi:hypothetical protein
VAGTRSSPSRAKGPTSRAPRPRALVAAAVTVVAVLNVAANYVVLQHTHGLVGLMSFYWYALAGWVTHEVWLWARPPRHMRRQ